MTVKMMQKRWGALELNRTESASSALLVTFLPLPPLPLYYRCYGTQRLVRLLPLTVNQVKLSFFKKKRKFLKMINSILLVAYKV